MMRSSKDTLAARLHALREKFLVKLPERCGEMSVISGRIRLQTAELSELRVLQGHAHALAGTGLTFGFSHISEASFALESELKLPNPDIDTILKHTRQLIASCIDASHENATIIM